MENASIHGASITTAPALPANRTKRRLLARFRFSLRALLLAVLLIGAVTTLIVHWDSWVLALRIEDPHPDEQYRWSAFSPDSRRFVICGCRGRPRVWNAQTGELEAVNSSWLPSQFTPDGKRLLIEDLEENCVRVWDVATHTVTLRIPDKEHGLDGGFFSASGAIYLCVPRDQSIIDPFAQTPGQTTPVIRRESGLKVFSDTTGDKQFEIGFKPGMGCDKPCISADGKVIVGIVANGFGWTAWDAQTGKELPNSGRVTNTHEHLYHLSLSRDGQQLLTHSYKDSGGGITRLWRMAAGQVTAIDDKPGDGGVISTNAADAEFRPDGNSILIRTDSGISILDGKTYQSQYALKINSDVGITDCCQSPDGNTLLVMHDNDAIDIFRRRRPEPLYGILWLPEFWTAAAVLGAIGWLLVSSIRGPRVNPSALTSAPTAVPASPGRTTAPTSAQSGRGLL